MSAPITPNYVAFDEGGNFVDFAAFDAVLATTPTDPGPTDVFVFSHGWNNNFADASQTYGAVIGQMTNVADRVSGLRPDPFRPLAFGVIWPSKAWDDGAGGAFESTVPFASSDLVAAVYENLSPQRASPAGYRHDVMRVQQLVLKNTLDASETTEFLGLLRRHADPATAWAQDNLFDQPNPEEGLEGLTLPSFSPGDLFRIFTYWQMKKRAGVVGGTGVRALIAAVQNRFSAARIHLLGHSFGCKVMLAALAGSGTPLPRAVQTVVLLQGAVSYQALANQVIGTDSPGGYRAVLEQSRVDGPIVVTFSQFDKACSEAYPLASRAANQTGELEGVLDRFRAMGAIGAFDIGPGLEQRTPMRQECDAYQFRNRGVWSVDGGDPALITGHSDIRTPQIAWLIWSAIRRR